MSNLLDTIRNKSIIDPIHSEMIYSYKYSIYVSVIFPRYSNGNSRHYRRGLRSNNMDTDGSHGEISAILYARLLPTNEKHSKSGSLHELMKRSWRVFYQALQFLVSSSTGVIWNVTLSLTIYAHWGLVTRSYEQMWVYSQLSKLYNLYFLGSPNLNAMLLRCFYHTNAYKGILDHTECNYASQVILIVMNCAPSVLSYGG